MLFNNHSRRNRYLFECGLYALLAVALGELGSAAVPESNCQDLNENCRNWVFSDPAKCTNVEFIRHSCLRSCGVCFHLPPQYDLKNLPDRLRPLDWLVGVWRNEAGGKAFFPTIPKFTYGEQIEISIAEPGKFSALPSLNYTTFAWGMNRKVPNEELHSESGFITISERDGTVALSTVMSNGFVTVEEGTVSGRSIRFRLADIGRISFSRDLPVHDLIREWKLRGSNTLQARLQMETLTHSMREHTAIEYTKVFP